MTNHMKILAADDHWLARSAMSQLLKGSYKDTEILEAESFEEVVEQLEEHEDIDLILADLVMPLSCPLITDPRNS